MGGLGAGGLVGLLAQRGRGRGWGWALPKTRTSASGNWGWSLPKVRTRPSGPKARRARPAHGAHGLDLPISSQKQRDASAKFVKNVARSQMSY